VWYVHKGQTPCSWRLRLREFGLTGEAAGLRVECDTCQAGRGLQEAFEGEHKEYMPLCRGRSPHLREFDEGCSELMQPILLGASNSWFPLTLSALAIPKATERLPQLVEEHWPVLINATTPQILAAFRLIGQLRAFATYSDDEIFSAIQEKREAQTDDKQEPDQEHLREPEWKVFTNPSEQPSTSDFRLREVGAPEHFGDVISRVVLAERLREVEAFLGFTRIESPGDFSERIEIPEGMRGSISRHAPLWVPAVEVHGEGIFLQFSEAAIQRWLNDRPVIARSRKFREAHRRWRASHGLPASDTGFPGMRYVLLHSLSHALVRQLALECGYGAASMQERVYSAEPAEEGGPMAGILIYTAASDSEGTLGGLVSLGEPQHLQRHLQQALQQIALCASDPLCSEHQPTDSVHALHGAACHACLFLPETSCERGNRYLDRAVLAPTFVDDKFAFFRSTT
jgi:Domain of unknown function (DUF1998)